MTIRVALEHRTTYKFNRPVRVHPHTVRLRPAAHSRTPIEAYSLRVKPKDHFLNWQQDPFGNYMARLVFPEKVRELDIVVDLVADMTSINPFDFFVEEYAEDFPFTYPPDLLADLDPYLQPVAEGNSDAPGPLVTEWMGAHGLHRAHESMRIVDFLVKVNSLINAEVEYTVRLEHGVQTPDETLTKKLGSCRDSAWLMVSVMRELGLAARFVSGYLVQLTSDVKPLDGPSGPEQDFTDLHAWAEVYVPGAGWIGLDPTSALFAGEGHIPLSCTPHPATAAPIVGATDPCEVEFSFHNEVTRIHEDARVTAPYDETQWSAIDELGAHVDDLLAQGDVRLTMGGEPTFVSAQGTESPEWETDADGAEKREKAVELAKVLKDRWAPGGLVHHGQGKWYPGEPLPRWQIQLTWRQDGQPLWRDESLLDWPWAKPREIAPESVMTFATEIAREMGVPVEHLMAAYEDPWSQAWDEARQPAGERPGEDPSISRLDRTVEKPQAWVVPLFEDPDGEGWGSALWRVRRSRLFLVPGTSPAGYRLPLDSLAWNPPPESPERSAFEEASDHPQSPLRIMDIEYAPRHALCLEVREGHLCAFLPPMTTLARALELIGAVEQAASATNIPVVIEGYGLPFDTRTRSLSVTPDPGVIEVNVQPTANWAELRELTNWLYEDARGVHLATEKFDVDGTHTGTGGGNHFTLGGATPKDSPMLRRPDLLRSLLTYWQHHPALSYVFSGRFIGPTSQAPRVDEGRHETLYELEIAFAELERLVRDHQGDDPRVGDNSPAWLADRGLRHLLTDITGNTHRSEFCIDKLYSPGSERGRLGLLEMRGFEMPPHPKMALVQALLVRMLVAKFWEEPYQGKLVRWGTRLHDRFLLPAFATADLFDVVEDLQGVGGFQKSWLDPFLEFRFPRLGTTSVAGAKLELRGAIEPWHVLGEEVSMSGTSRYVDSSVERVQVSAEGLVEGRHVLTCNGVPVPLTALGDAHGSQGTFVAGVRFRAWSPWSALHPSIGVHAPLVFDVVDTWSSRSVGGFTYHVSHPGGRSYDDYPVNANAAEARRNARFSDHGHTSGKVDMSEWPDAGSLLGVGTEYPVTLDLRRFSSGREVEYGRPDRPAGR